jgi:hypothetical protein
VLALLAVGCSKDALQSVYMCLVNKYQSFELSFIFYKMNHLYLFLEGRDCYEMILSPLKVYYTSVCFAAERYSAHQITRHNSKVQAPAPKGASCLLVYPLAYCYGQLVYISRCSELREQDTLLAARVAPAT